MRSTASSKRPERLPNRTSISRAVAGARSSGASKGGANKHRGSSIDRFLEEEGVLEEFQARAVKEVIAWQLDQAMKERNLSKRRLAVLMRTSRTQIDRVLDPKDGNVTIETLQRAAAILGRKVQVELV
jgi:hypothetical protein